MKTPSSYLFVVLLLATGAFQGCDTLQSDAAPQPESASNALVIYTMPNASAAIDLKANARLAGATTYRIESQPSSGKLQFMPSGLLMFTPDSTVQEATDYFTISANTAGGTSQVVKDTVRIVVTEDASQLPCDAGAMPDKAPVATNGDTLIAVLDNDRFCAGAANAGSLTIAQAPEHGTATVKDGKIEYTPSTGYQGLDMLLYRVCTTGPDAPCYLASVYLLVGLEAPSGPCTAPAQVLPDYAAVATNADTLIGVLNNDVFCAPMDKPSFAITRAPRHGTARLQGGNVQYTPNPGYAGRDSLSYRICTAAPNAQCYEGWVYITVGAQQPCVFIAAPDDVTWLIQENPDSLVVKILSNDALCGPANDFQVIIQQQPTNGQAYISKDEKWLVYKRKNGFTGLDRLVYTVCNRSNACRSAYVNITITP